MTRTAARLAVALLALSASCQGPTRELLVRRQPGMPKSDAGPGTAVTTYQDASPPFFAAGTGAGAGGDSMSPTDASLSDQCMIDTDCTYGMWCLKGACAACPALKCPACASGFTYLMRNGCQTCDCGPPSQCTDQSCGANLACVQGAVCASECSRLDCCANVCAEPACPAPAPSGCAMKCADSSCANVVCRAEKCTCDSATKSWVCYGACEDGAAACMAP